MLFPIEILPRASRPVAVDQQGDWHSCDVQLFRCMKEMNKCFSFHQSQSSTSLCSRCSEICGRHAPSIFPSPSQTATVLRLKKYLEPRTLTSQTLCHKGNSLLSHFCLNLRTNLRSEENGWADILHSTPLPFSFVLNVHETGTAQSNLS